MKSPSFLEFTSIIQFLNDELVQAQLQEVQATPDGVVLGFYRFTLEPKTVWLVLDLDMQFPFVGLYDFNPWNKLKKPKPLSLFINSHFKNTRLKTINLIEQFGRVAQFDFSTELSALHLELRLIPKQPNLIATADHKKISWDKVKDLANVSTLDQSEFEQQECRSIPFMFEQWKLRRSSSSVSSSILAKDKLIQKTDSPYDLWVKQMTKNKLKKEKALSQILQQINDAQLFPWSQLGHHLKVYGYQDLPPEWAIQIDQKHKVSVNIEKCFEKSKQIVQKEVGAKQRIVVLEQEIKQLDNLSTQAYEKYLDQKPTKKLHLAKKGEDVSFRQMTLADSSLVIMGKSARDNLNILRRSKAWDFWLHLKDYPSAYAILQRNKDKSISDQILIEASQWMAKESFKNKKNFEGVKLSVVVTECRHVRPIKGDHIGRVTYHHAREFLITL